MSPNSFQTIGHSVNGRHAGFVQCSSRYITAWAHGERLGDYRTIQGAKCAITRAHKIWIRQWGYGGSRIVPEVQP